MGENQKELLDFILHLTEEQVEKIVAELPRLKELIDNEEPKEKKWLV